MATVVERVSAGGAKKYFAQIRVHRHGKVAHSESRTFDRKGDASAWSRRREAELKAMPTEVLAGLKVRGCTLGDAIDRYMAELVRPAGSTKAQVLRSLKTFEIAGLPCAEITSVEIVALARDLSDGRSPQTVATYLSHLGTIFAIAEPAWGIPLDADAMRSARSVCVRLGLTGKSVSRDRRPTIDEMGALMAYFDGRKHSLWAKVPMVEICIFAMFSTRRQEEITRILRSDFDAVAGRIMVRDMKHPGDKAGNDVWCDLPDPALRILRGVRGEGPQFFPFNSQTVSSNFTRACKRLGIAGLRFHDLRHEGISRLFEMGLTIPKAASVSGHRSWQSLQRYSHIRQSGDKWAEWEWLDRF